MKSLFARALWGDDIIHRHARILAQIQSDMDRAHGPPAPLCVYAFGNENAEFLRSMNRSYDVRLIDEAPVVNWLDAPARNPDPRGNQNYGANQWWHKLRAIQAAFEDGADEVVWLDWDCRLAKPLPEDFWPRMRKGAPIQISLVCYENIQCGWRPRFRNLPGGSGRRLVGEGAFIYLRDRQILEDLLVLARQRPIDSDQQLISWWIDAHEGDGDPTKGWQGTEHYKARGYQPYCHGILHLIWPPEEMVFATRRPVTEWSKRLERAQRKQGG